MGSNIAFGIINELLLIALPGLTAIALADFAAQNGWGLFNQLGWPWWAEFALSFLALDLLGYDFHRASHQWRPLWRIHRIHHSDPDPDITTGFRAHPLTLAVYFLPQLSVIVALGLSPMGVLARTLARHVTMIFGHARIAAAPLLERWVGWLVVTPRFHLRHHHSSAHTETDSNYGEVLAIWDWLFRSRSPLEHDVARYGLGERYDHDAGSIVSQLKLPFDQR